MFRFIIPGILIGIAVVGFLLFTNPLYKEVLKLREQISSYNEALDNSKSLEAERDKLTQKYNSIDPENIVRLEKMMPDNVDNIRLILEIEKIILPYGMVLKDIKYDTIAKKDPTLTPGAANPNTQNTTVGSVPGETNKSYGVWNLEFSTTGSYSNFLNFLKDLENNLRIVDVSAIVFSSDGESSVVTPGLGSTPVQSSNVYKYSFKIRTYWLKN